MKNKIIILICILSIFALIECDNIKNTSKIKIEYEKNIMTMKIHNIKGEFKGIKNKTDINQAIDLVKSVKVIKSNVEPIDGVGYGVEITYTDGKKENISFSSTYMIHDGKYYEVDKNVVNDLKSIYDKI